MSYFPTSDTSTARKNDSGLKFESLFHVAFFPGHQPNPKARKIISFRAPEDPAFGHLEKETLKCEGKQRPMRGCDRC
jgi:hypothetical protein